MQYIYADVLYTQNGTESESRGSMTRIDAGLVPIVIGSVSLNKTNMSVSVSFFLPSLFCGVTYCWSPERSIIHSGLYDQSTQNINDK